MRYFASNFLRMLLIVQAGLPSAQAKASKVFLLEDAGNNQWCSYLSEPKWKARVQETGAMTVGTLIYSDGRLSQIDVTETDESGDWTVYDHYLLDEHGQIVKLSRVLNVLPGDRSVSQTFAIRNGKADKIATREERLSNGKPVTKPTGDWLPDVTIDTNLAMFPFSSLLNRPSLRTSARSCVEVSAQ